MPSGRRRHASRGRRAAPGTPRSDSHRPAAPSVAEVAVYGVLAALIAGGLLIVAGQPRWIAGAVVGGTLAMIGLLALLARRARNSAPRRRRRKR